MSDSISIFRIFVPVTDFERAIEFYQRLLPMKAGSFIEAANILTAAQ